MKIGIMQPYLFPYIGYWQLIHAVDAFVVYDDVNYKRGWINRNNILLNGERRLFTIKLEGASQCRLINDIAILDTFSGFVKTLRQYYNKTPFFREVMDLLNKIIMFDKSNLAAFIAGSISIIAEYMEIDTKLLMSSDIEKNNSLKGQAKIIDICNILRATEYINAIGGVELYNAAAFKENGVKLKFLKTNFVPYEQFKNEFIPGLSIIDVMMFNSKEKIRDMLKNYELFAPSTQS